MQHCPGGGEWRGEERRGEEKRGEERREGRKGKGKEGREGRGGEGRGGRTFRRKGQLMREERQGIIIQSSFSDVKKGSFA